MPMELRIMVDDRALRNASRLTGLTDPAAIITHVLEQFVREGVTQQLIDRGGTDPTASAPPRRRAPNFRSDEAGEAGSNPA